MKRTPLKKKRTRDNWTNEDWRKEAINRLKEHIKKMNSEMEAMNYIKDELTKQGYTALFLQRAGFRPQRFR